MRLPLLYGFTFITLLGSSASAAFKINEVDSDTLNPVISGTTVTDYLEFVELKGNPFESVSGLKLVLFNGAASGTTARAYRAYDLGTTITADANGYVLVGTQYHGNADWVNGPNILQNGEDAVALYNGGTFVTSGASATQPHSTGLLDYVVYESGADTNATNWGGFDPGYVVYNEAGFGNGAGRSLSRIPDTSGGWQPAEPSPKAANFTSKGLTTPASPVDLGRINQFMTASLPLHNNGTAPVTISSATLDPGTSSALSIVGSFPVTIAPNQTTSAVVLQFDGTATVSTIYGGSVTINTDVPSSPTVSASFVVELVRVTQSAASGAVRINEICYNPTSGTITNDYNRDGVTASQNDEFIEFYNTTAAPIVIQGWENKIIQSDLASQNSYVFPAGATIPANGWVTVFALGTPVGFLPNTTFVATGARIYNIGSFVSLSDGTTNIDRVAYSLAEDSPDSDGYTNMGFPTIPTNSPGSIGRRPDGANAFRYFAHDDATSTDRPSPNTSNAATAAGHWSMYE
ncbi:MAG: lamin tail domain-containing protein [Candidatus Sumerlaeaceae bacterium]